MLNNSTLNSLAINASSFVAGTLFLAASSVAEATVSSSAERLAKSSVQTTAEVQSAGMFTRYAGLDGEAFGSVNLVSDSTRFAYALAEGGSNVLLSGTAVRHAYLGSDFATGAADLYDTSVNLKITTGVEAVGDVESGGMFDRHAYLDPRSVTGAAYSFNDSAFTSTWTVRFVDVTASGIVRGQTHAFANSWMGFGVSQIFADATGDFTHIKAVSGQAEIESVTSTDPYKVALLHTSARAEAFTRGEPSVYRASDGTTYHFGYSETAAEALLSSGATRLVKTPLTFSVWGETFAYVTPIRAAMASTEIEAIASAAFRRAHPSTGSATGALTLVDDAIRNPAVWAEGAASAEVGAQASAYSATVMVQADAGVDVSIEASYSYYPAVWAEGAASAEGVVETDPQYQFAGYGDTSIDLLAHTTAYAVRPAIGGADGAVDAHDDSVLILSASGSSVCECGTIGQLRIWHYADADALVELQAVAYGRAGINQIAAGDRTYTESGDGRFLSTPADNRKLEV